MSAPDTNIEKQKRRHFGPLWGIALVLAVAGVAIFAVPLWSPEVEDEAAAEIGVAPVEASQ